MDKAEQIKADMQIESKVRKMIYNRVFVGLPNGEVKLYGVEEVAEEIRNYFEGMYLNDPQHLCSPND